MKRVNTCQYREWRLPPTILHALEYGSYDLKRLLQPKAAPATGATLDLVFWDNILADLRQHVGNYPPNSDSPADAQRARRDATALMGMLNAMFSTATWTDHAVCQLCGGAESGDCGELAVGGLAVLWGGAHSTACCDAGWLF
ncbi:MAG: hypothetical protein A3F78_15155 [Burkholderiales bacterium RIFCSPLOWO2_12_FULL_61_40]|nr:MAG: hypothetical protein A3F78_15155 [Burkholderiales bacterium RIFCSPLOWO2_12_FULL_61_40]